MVIVPLIQKNVKNVISVYIFTQIRPFVGFDNTYADTYKYTSATSLTHSNFFSPSWMAKEN